VVFEAGGCTVAAECDIVEADSAVPVDAQDIPLLLNVIVSLRNNAKMEIRQVSSAPDEPRRWWTDGLGSGADYILCGGGGDQRTAVASDWARITTS
jgi:hypothetical protein